MTQDELLPEIKLDTDSLYREEMFTDRQVGSIVRLTPVTVDGDDDSTRPVLYMGQTQVLTPGGPLPLSFEIDAANLAEAVDGFADAARQAVEETMERIKEMRREAASSLVIPGAGGGDLGGLGGGGVPGGGSGKIQLR